MLINNGATSTTSRNVTLNVTWVGATNIRIANSASAINSSGYQALANQLSWTLSAGNGTKQVCVQLRYNVGTAISPIYCDDIVLNQSPSSYIFPTGVAPGMLVKITGNPASIMLGKTQSATYFPIKTPFFRGIHQPNWKAKQKED